MKTFKLSSLTLIALIIEADQFVDLTYTRENIEINPKNLSREGQFIWYDLKSNGITTSDQVDDFYLKHIYPILKTE